MDIGFWLYLLAMGVIIAGSIMGLRMLSSSLPLQAQQEGADAASPVTMTITVSLPPNPQLPTQTKV